MSSSADAPPDSPRVTLAITGKNTSTAAIIIFESGLSVPNQLFMSGANATIGDGVRRDRQRHERVARAMNRAVMRAAPRPAEVPMTSPPRPRRSSPAMRSSASRVAVPVIVERPPIAEGRGKRKAFRSRREPTPRVRARRRRPGPSASRVIPREAVGSPNSRPGVAGAPSTGAAALHRPAPRSPSVWRSDPRPSRIAPSSAAQRSGTQSRARNTVRSRACHPCAAPAGRFDHLRDLPRPRLMTTTRQVRKTAPWIEWSRTRSCPRLGQIRWTSSFIRPRHRVERAMARPSEVDGSKASARRSQRAAASLPTVATGVPQNPRARPDRASPSSAPSGVPRRSP